MYVVVETRYLGRKEGMNEWTLACMLERAGGAFTLFFLAFVYGGREGALVLARQRKMSVRVDARSRYLM